MDRWTHFLQSLETWSQANHALALILDIPIPNFNCNWLAEVSHLIAKTVNYKQTFSEHSLFFEFDCSVYCTLLFCLPSNMFIVPFSAPGIACKWTKTTFETFRRSKVCMFGPYQSLGLLSCWPGPQLAIWFRPIGGTVNLLLSCFVTFSDPQSRIWRNLFSWGTQGALLPQSGWALIHRTHMTQNCQLSDPEESWWVQWSGLLIVGVSWMADTARGHRGTESQRQCETEREFRLHCRLHSQSVYPSVCLPMHYLGAALLLTHFALTHHDTSEVCSAQQLACSVHSGSEAVQCLTTSSSSLRSQHAIKAGDKLSCTSVVLRGYTGGAGAQFICTAAGEVEPQSMMCDNELCSCQVFPLVCQEIVIFGGIINI